MNNKLILPLLLALPLSAQAGSEDNGWNVGLAVTATQSPFKGGSSVTGAKPVLPDKSGFGIAGPALSVQSTSERELYVAVGLDEWDYQRGDSTELQGMDDLKRAVNLRIGSAWKLAPGVLSVDLGKDVLAHKGVQAKVRYTHNPVPHQAKIRPYAEVQLLSAEMTDYYVGVNAHEANANRPAYQASSSTAFKAGVSLEHSVTPTLTLVGGLDATRYSTEITDSPIIDKNTIWGGYAGFTYRW